MQVLKITSDFLIMPLINLWVQMVSRKNLIVNQNCITIIDVVFSIVP
jgi:hypothetical protein